jgi:hypothetical protein
MRRWRDLTVVGVAIVAIIVLLVVLGGSKSEQALPPATTTTATTLGPTTTTTTLPEQQLGGPSGIRLLVSSQRGVFLVDLDRGTRSLVSPSTSASYSVLPHGVVAQDGKGVEYLDDGADQPGLLLGTADVVLASPRADRLWLVGYSSANARVREVDTSGAATAGPFDITAAGVMYATDDALVTSIHGVVQAFDRQGRSRAIGTGQVLAAGGRSVVVSMCEGATCGLSVIDVSTGATTTVDGFVDPGALRTPPGRVSPDGRTAAIFDTAEDSVRVRLVDLATGRITNSGPALDATGPALLAWSRDSRWLFCSNGGAVQALAVDGSGAQPIDIGELAPAMSLAAI